MTETILLSHLPPDLPIYITLYHSVQNAPFLRQQLLAGNSEFEYAFIDASMIVSRTHILAACFRALNDYLGGRLKSKNVHSEIVFALSTNNNILEAFRKFGIQDSTTNLLIIKVPVPNTPAIKVDPPTITTAKEATSKESIEKHILSSIQGNPLSFDDETLAGMCDIAKVRKAYKITAAARKTEGDAHADARLEYIEKAEVANERTILERAILGAMALRGAT